MPTSLGAADRPQQRRNLARRLSLHINDIYEMNEIQ
jgi:hypothetical protein